MYASSFGEYATILAPQEAVDAMRRRLEESLRNYL
jgi:predicted DNA-binding transcriptional regulator YafY